MSGPRTLRLDTPQELADLMRWKFSPSPEQWEAIRAPLAPAVVIAGAGSGKTTLMAARVVYLVATGQVRPDQVLGLTFTTKAASQLRAKIHEALTAAELLDDLGTLVRDVARTTRPTTPSNRPSRPTTPTPPGCSPTTACASATSPTPGC